MPQVTYLVLEQVRARLADPLTGFNELLSIACLAQRPQPDPFVIDFTDGSTNFWQSQTTAEELDETSTNTSGPLCLLYGVKAVNQTGTYQKFAVFSGTVQVAVDFEISWPESFNRSNTEGLANATEDAMIQCFNSASYFGSFGAGVIWNGLIEEGPRGPLRQSGSGWRQRIPFLLTFEVQA